MSDWQQDVVAYLAARLLLSLIKGPRHPAALSQAGWQSLLQNAARLKKKKKLKMKPGVQESQTENGRRE